MGLLGTITQESYYNQSQSFNGDGSNKAFALTKTNFPTLPPTINDIEVFINEVSITPNNYGYVLSGSNENQIGTITFTNTDINTDVQETDGAPKNDLKVLVREISDTEQYGNYQFISIEDLINNFIVSYVGEGKIINRVRKSDVAFHAQRGIQEFSYDTFKSTKSQEIEIPPSLTMVLPQDYVNYVKLSWRDNDGIENRLYPARDTSNPSALLQDSNFKYLFDSNGNIQKAFNSETWEKYSASSSNYDEFNDASNDKFLDMYSQGGRYGVTPEYAQNNGSFFIDQIKGVIYFSSNVSEKVVTLKYISDGLGTDSEMLVHKFAEEAMYKYLAHAVLSSKSNIPEFIINRFKKERFAEIRKAKLRLSNLKSEELTQIMRNKSKHIKH